MFKHDIVELSTAVKGRMLCKLFEEGAKKVVYLDPDIAVFSSLQEVVDLLDEKSVILTPHLSDPEKDDFVISSNEIGSLKHGVFNLGFVAVSARPEGIRFARWWRDRSLSYYYDDIPNGLFTDQKWCNLVPAFFDEVFVLRDSGYNVACWNINQRPISIDASGVIYAGDRILRFFHFTKVRGSGEEMIERFARGHVATFELMYWYRAQLDRLTAANVPARWWAYSSYDNGNTIPKHHRVIYRSDPALQIRYPNPYKSGPDSFETYIASCAQT